MSRIAALAGRLRRDSSGIAMLEFAFILPIFLVLSLTGAELTNYVITRMRVSQMALHLADNAARIGTGTMLQAKTISEADVNDLLTGTGLQSGELDIYGKGRVIISDVEPMASPNTTNKYKIVWQRCRGSKTDHASTFGKAGDTNLAGVGPNGRQITAPDDGATMFVEVYYEYTPLVKTSLSPSTTMTETASMMVRDRRDLSDDSKLANGSVNPNPQHPNGIYKVAGVTPSTC